MRPTYKALLHGDHLEWDDDVPDEARGQASTTVLVTFVGNKGDVDESRGRRMADALGRLAARGGPSIVGPATEWQRDLRADRPLPGREG